MRSVIFIFSIFILFVSISIGEVPPPPDCANISVSVAHTGDNSTVGLTAGSPFEKGLLDGYVVLSGQHIQDSAQDASVSSRVFYVESGIKMLERLELSVFGKVLRNSERAIDRQLDYGYFVELHALDLPKRKLSAGFGNFARNEIEELSAAAQSTFHWSFFLRKQFSSFTAQYTLTAQSDFSDWEHTLMPSWDLQIKDNLSVSIDLTLIRADGLTHTASQTGLTYKF